VDVLIKKNFVVWWKRHWMPQKKAAYAEGRLEPGHSKFKKPTLPGNM